MPTMGAVQALSPHGAEEVGGDTGWSEGEEPAVGGHLDVAPVVRVPHHAHDGRVQAPSPMEPKKSGVTPGGAKEKSPPSEATSM